MPESMATDCTTDEEIQKWHDEAYAEYEAALQAHSANVEDPDLKAAYHDAAEQLSTGVKYWRQVGEQLGTRTGVVTEDDTL